MRKQNDLLLQPEIGTFIDPLSDFGFKRLFGSEPSKVLLMHFLNELFKGRKVITDLVYNNNERSGMVSQSRKMIYDLTCTGQDGEQFIIEVQRIRQEFFKDRAVYYSSGLIQDQAPKGKSDWDYSLKEVYFIGLMDSVLEDSATEEYLHHVRLVYEKSGQEFYKKLGFIFIEIPKFTKSEEDLKTGVDKWLFILKNMSRLQKNPVILNTRIFSKLFKIAAVANLTKEEFMKYAKDQKASWDEYATKQTLLKEGMELGMEEAKYQVVRKLLLTDRFTIAEVANFATVTEAFVSKVKKNLK